MPSHEESQVAEVIAEDVHSNYVTIEIARHSACKKCGVCDFGMSGNKTAQLELENTVDASIGDRVMVDMEGKDIVMASVLIYLVPLISLLIGLFIGTKLAGTIGVDENLMGLFIGILLMGATYLGLKKFDQKIQTERPNKFKPRIVKKIN